MMPFLYAILWGDVSYEDELFNSKRTIFVDNISPQKFLVNVYWGENHHQWTLNGRQLFEQFRNARVSLSKGWLVYRCVIK